MTSPSVSVVVGTYNGARHIYEQLQSIFEQTSPPNEVVICDDCSADGTLEIVTALSHQYDVPVTIIRNSTRLGFADNFLNGASHARSDFVAFADQDDVWHPEKLHKVMTALHGSHALFAAHAVDLIAEDGSPIGSDSQGIGATRVVDPGSERPWRNFFGFTIVVHRSLLGAIPWSMRGPDTHTPQHPLSHDRWVTFVGLSLGRAVFIAEPLARYRQHDSQLFGSSKSKRSQHWTGLVHALQARLEGIASVDDRTHFLAAQATLRAELLTIAKWPDDHVRIAAVERWRFVAHQYNARRSVYAGSRFNRTVSLIRLLRRGIYGRTQGVGPRAFIQDSLSLVLPQSTTMRDEAISE